MTLELIKDSISTISLSHIKIKSFDYGEEFLQATGKGLKYPMVFLEIPYSITYEIPVNRDKVIAFALQILLNPSFDAIKDDHVSISDAEVIGDQILTRIQSDIPQLNIESVDGVSLRNHSNDNVAGFRYDIKARVSRECVSPTVFH